MSEAIGIIVAAGRGTRMGAGQPKQFRALLGRSVLGWSVAAFADHPGIRQTIVVAPAGETIEVAARLPDDVTVVAGGASRSQSVFAGLSACQGADDLPVLIHDAARPGLSSDMISRLLEAVQTADAAAPALPIADALKRIDGDALETVDRTPLRRVQTPQVFRLGMIRNALNAPGDWVDDLAAVEKLGAKIALITGSERLRKLTYEEDFAIMSRLLTPISSSPRLGTGYDVHALGPGTAVTLCGVTIAHDQGLVGHSDADVGWHALTDAILGALAAGDIGDHFPPSDPQWKGAPSSTFLSHAVSLARQEGFQIGNVDLTLICEAPKIKPHREAMRVRTAEVLQITPAQVSVKATTTEGLGFTGRREGIAAQASAVLTPLPKVD